MSRPLGLIGGMAFLSAMSPQSAAAIPISVSYTVSGSAGDWMLDFSVTNDFDITEYPDQRIYFWGTTEPFDSVTGSPSDWHQDLFNAWTDPGSDLVYPESWQSGYFTDPENIFPGETLSGFDVVDTSLNAPDSVDFFAYSTGATTYTGGDDFSGATSNPGFDGVALPSGAPEPATLTLVGAGLAALIVARRRTMA